MAHPNEELIRRFYTAFVESDAETMGKSYHDEATFHDPAFGLLNAAQVRAMWKMLLANSKGPTTRSFSDVVADDKSGRAHWEAIYTFSRTGRRVHNKIDATFEFRDGKIFRHVDNFSFWRWSSMALGPVGMLLGFTPFLRNKFQKTTGGLLADYMKQNG